MSVETAEVSDYSGRPVMLYTFTRGTRVWRYAAGESDVTVGGHDYTAYAILDEGFTQSNDPGQDEVTINVPATSPIVEMFRVAPPSERVRVEIRRWHVGETGALVCWLGSIDRVQIESEAAAKVLCRPPIGSNRRNGLRLPWVRNCPHALYDLSCSVDKAAFCVGGSISEMTGTTLTAVAWESAPSGAFMAGFVEWTTADGYTERRGVVAHDGATLTVLGSTFGIEVGDSVFAYFGCPHTADACNSVFGNLENFGGFRHMPERSPFDGSPVF